MAGELCKLLAARARMDLAVVARSPRIVLVWFVSDVLGYAAGVATPLLITARFGGIGRWHGAQMLVLLGFGACVAAWRNIFFGYNLSVISRRIGRGQLDHSLIQPRPLWVTFTTEGFSPFTSSGPAIFGTALLVYGGVVAHINPLWTLANLAGSIVIGLGYQYAWGCIAFWAPYGAEELNSTTDGLLFSSNQLPLDGTRGLLRTTVMSVVPVAFMSWFPARALVGFAPGQLWVTPAVAAGVAAIALALFRKGLQHYARTGSRRYSDMGHRR